MFAHKHKKVDGRKPLAKALSKKALLLTTTKLRDYEVPKWIEGFAKEKGFKMPAEKIDAFLNNKGFGKGGHNMRNRSRSASPKEEQKVETSSSDETEEDKATIA